jgi:hypothetical protein
MRKANLQGTQLAKTDIRGSKLGGCRIYGLSAWDLKPDKKSQQENLIIAYGQERAARMAREPDENLVVDDLTVAQFIYLLLHNQTIGNTIESISKKVVLILGRFTDPRKIVLDGIREWLRQNNWVPLLFDFVRPDKRDFTETIKTLASLSQFIIVDVTNPRSSPLEMQALVPDYAIPIVPIIRSGEKPFAMFDDLKKYLWVLRRLVSYESVRALKSAMKREVVTPALAMAKVRRAEETTAFRAGESLHQAEHLFQTLLHNAFNGGCDGVVNTAST